MPKCRNCGKEHERRIFCSKMCGINFHSKRYKAEGTYSSSSKDTRVREKIPKEIDYENMTAKEIMMDLHYGYRELMKCIADGMPYHLNRMGDKRFDLLKCQAWHRGEIV